MRLFFAYDYPESGTWSVLNSLLGPLRKMGCQVDTLAVDNGKGVPEGFDLSLSDYDAAHFWNLRSAVPFEPHISIPYGVTVHQFVPGTDESVFVMLRDLAPLWVHVMDNFSEQQLGRHGVISFYTPQTMTRDGLVRLPVPKEHMIGCLGANGDGFKRFNVIDGAARLVGLPCKLHDSSKCWTSKEEVDDFFEQVSIYVNACFGCTGPIPPQEALLKGRPVVTVKTTTMLEVVESGVNGEFFDGSALGAAKAIRKILSDYPRYSDGAASSLLNDPAKSAEIFLREIQERL